MRWFNTTDNPEPDVPSLTELKKPLADTETKEEKSGLMDILSDPKVQELGSKALKVGSQISNAATSNVTRQERLNKCGRRPVGTGVISKKMRAKIDAYNKCVADANKSMPSGDKSLTPTTTTNGRSSNMTYIVIGAIVVLGGIAYFALKRK